VRGLASKIRGVINRCWLPVPCRGRLPPAAAPSGDYRRLRLRVHRRILLRAGLVCWKMLVGDFAVYRPSPFCFPLAAAVLAPIAAINPSHLASNSPLFLLRGETCRSQFDSGGHWPRHLSPGILVQVPRIQLSRSVMHCTDSLWWPVHSPQSRRPLRLNFHDVALLHQGHRGACCPPAQSVLDRLAPHGAGCRSWLTGFDADAERQGCGRWPNLPLAGITVSLRWAISYRTPDRMHGPAHSIPM